MSSQKHPDARITLADLAAEYALSVSTWRRALRDPVDPLPFQKVGLGDAAHARILVRRGDVEAWLERRNRALSPKSIVDEVVAAVLG